jgi:hypothetical protein
MTAARVPHAVTLKRLGDNMAATGMDPDHPWMLAIATALNGDEPIFDAVDDIDRAAGIIDDLLGLAVAQCSSENEAGSAIRAARRYLVDISVATTFISGAAV